MDLIELGKTPISEENPAGDDVRYEPEMDELQTEIDKMSSATAVGEGIDWKKVVTLGQQILGEKSKNIQVAAYLGAGLLATQGLEGYRIGQVILKDLVENFWENMYPPLKRKRGRFNAVTWWADRAEAFFQEFETAPLPEEQVTAIKDDLAALDEALSAKDDEAPMLGRQLGDFINRLPVQVKEEPAAEAAPAAPADEAAPTTAAPSAGAAPAAPVSEMGSAADAEKLLEFGLGQLTKVADWYMEHEMHNPMAYRLNRLAAWLTLESAPPAEGGQSMIPPPNEAIREAYDNLWANKDYETLLQGVEGSVREYLFWLDLSRIAAQCLDAMGGRYGLAATVVAEETTMFVRRLPGIEKMSFSDGTPFADGETKAWLKTIELGEGGGGGGSDTAPGDGPGAEVAAAVSEVQVLIRDKKKDEAIRRLEEGMMRGASGRSRLMWRAALAQTLQGLGLKELARPHYSAMLDRVDEYRLEEWDPPLALQCLRTAYEGYLMEDTEEATEAAQRCLDRISRISPAEAMNLLK